MIKIEKNKTACLMIMRGWPLSWRQWRKRTTDTKSTIESLFDGACFWATDGHRVHYYYVKNNELDPGIYEIVSRIKRRS